MNRWRNCSTVLAVSSDGQRAKLAQNYRRRPSLTSVSFLVAERTRESTPANDNNSVLAKNPSKCWEFWAERKSTEIFTSHHHSLGHSEDESDAKIFSVPESGIDQQSSPHIQLELMRRQPQQGNADRVLVENNFDTTSATWRSKFSAVLLQLLCASAQLKIFYVAQTWTLFKLSDQDWIYFLW